MGKLCKTNRCCMKSGFTATENILLIVGTDFNSRSFKYRSHIYDVSD